MILLKYDNFRFYWAVVTEKKRLNSVYAKVSYLCAGILNDKLTFFSGHSCLCKVKQITQISERSFQYTP